MSTTDTIYKQAQTQMCALKANHLWLAFNLHLSQRGHLEGVSYWDNISTLPKAIKLTLVTALPTHAVRKGNLSGTIKNSVTNSVFKDREPGQFLCHGWLHHRTFHGKVIDLLTKDSLKIRGSWPRRNHSNGTTCHNSCVTVSGTVSAVDLSEPA